MFMAVRLQSENGHNGDSYIHLAPARTQLEDLCFMLELFISLIISKWYLVKVMHVAEGNVETECTMSR